MKEDKFVPDINTDEEDIDAAVKAAEEEAKNENSGIYELQFPTPFSFEGEDFDGLAFNYDAMTGADALSIESEMAAQGMNTVMPEFTGEFLIRLAMRACTTRRSDGRKLGLDFFRALPIGSFVKIRTRTRSFMLRAGLL